LSRTVLGGGRLRASTLIIACAAIPLSAACSRDDPVSVLEVTTTATPAVASIARDTRGVLVTVQVKNPLARPVKVAIRPGRSLSLRDGDAMAGPVGWGAGFAVQIESRDSTNHFSQFRFTPAPWGRTLTFGPGQTLSDTFRLGLRPREIGRDRDLQAGRFVIHGFGNRLVGPTVDLEVQP
jgi:hypothetical protein